MSPKWNRHTSGFDEETILFLFIVRHFLIQYFSHNEATADNALDAFMERLRWDEDLYHHEGAYRVAAMIHYLCDLGGDFSRHMEWLHESGNNKAPEEARNFFWQHYLTKR